MLPVTVRESVNAGFAVLSTQGHVPADVNCPGCWAQYPLPCNCGGLIHAHQTMYRDEDNDIHHEMHMCDNCGHNFRRQPRTGDGSSYKAGYYGY